MAYTFYFDASRCTGCKTCQTACKDYYDLPLDIDYRRVYDYEGGSWEVKEDGTVSQDAYAYHLSISCNHCEKPACTAVCPTTAMYKDPETGLVLVDGTKCIGCGYCRMACPYDAPRIDRSEKMQSRKCDGCYERTIAGKQTICVEACPLRALDFGPYEEIHEKYGDKAKAPNYAPMPDMTVTIPNLLVHPCPSMKPVDDTTGKVVNLKEVR